MKTYWSILASNFLTHRILFLVVFFSILNNNKFYEFLLVVFKFFGHVQTVPKRFKFESLKHSASNPDDEFGPISFQDIISNKEWFFLNGWFSDSEIIFSNVAHDSSSFDCFYFSDGNLILHTKKNHPGEEYRNFTQSSWRCVDNILSISVAGTISVGNSILILKKKI
jgi:hypothetical protein